MSVCKREMVVKAMQNPKGGLNAAGRAFYNKQGMHLKPPQTSNGARHKSFCARMSGNPGPMMKNGHLTRKALSLRAWCELFPGTVQNWPIRFLRALGPLFALTNRYRHCGKK